MVDAMTPHDVNGNVTYSKPKLLQLLMRLVSKVGKPLLRTEVLPCHEIVAYFVYGKAFTYLG